MSLNEQAQMMLPLIEAELKKQARRIAAPSTRAFHRMLSYHMGWVGTSARRRKGGKRVRPLICLLSCASVDGRWQLAVPAAAGIELVHNFSLVHDDIQDNSPTRRGRPTLWRRTGVPLAINSGDALFTISSLAALELKQSFRAEVVLETIRILEQACLDLTKGQFLDLHHQEKHRLSIKSYWEMIDGKTAALLAASTEIGALLGGASPARIRQYRKFGRLLGLAFQVQDDILGIWGEETRTGKSAASDLVEGKLSLPVVYGLGRSGEFARRWRDRRYRARNASRLRDLLEAEGALSYAQRHAKRLTHEAVKGLRALRPKGEAGAALEQLSLQLLSRSA